ncbi:MAG: alpha-amylase family glycosyl hydrolase [Anaerolineae bacterium]
MRSTLIAIVLAFCLAACVGGQAPAPPTAAIPTLTPPVAALPAPTGGVVVKSPDWAKDLILYQVFVRSFADSNGDGIGDLKGITQRLDYIQSLGANAIWLTPIFASPSYHGYDTSDYYAINPQFGTQEDLAELTREAHKRGIKVILDFVAGHTSNQHPFFQEAYGHPGAPHSEFYRWEDAGQTHYASFPGAPDLPSLNHSSPAVQQYLIDVAKHWLDLNGDGDLTNDIDGYRLDYALGVPHDFWKRFRQEVKAVNPNAILLGEVWTGNALEIKPFFDNEFDAAFDFPLYGTLEGSQDRTGDGVLNGQASAGLIDSDLGAADRVYPPGSVRVGFINNHDTNRVVSEVNGNLDRARTAATLLFTLPDPPMVYYGEEIGMQGTKGGTGVWDMTRREPMDWYAAGSGQGMTTWFQGPDNKANDGVSVQEEDGKAGSLLEHYRSLAKLRRESAALRVGDHETVNVDGNDKVYALVRRAPDDIMLGVFNFGDQTANVNLDLSQTNLGDTTYTVTNALSGATLPDLSGPKYGAQLPAAGSLLLRLKAK